ncbi:hypothetical protein CASFOL_024334 [Castilleja foliolosa]|uniref:Protein kinase domain-containing protein n=1 Tax=Castilleja foliolosa TaxID=1961234 RepID=A0ABD3CN00_9LAMI
MMSRVKLFIFLSLFHHLMIATNSNCPQSLQCGDLGPLQFPLTNTNHPTCGLVTLDCTNHSSPRIMLGDVGIWYDVLRRLSLNSFRIRYPIPPLSSDDLMSCNLFGQNLNNLPNSPSIYFNILSPVLTSFWCNDPPQYQDPALIDAYFLDLNYTQSLRCPRRGVVTYWPGGNGTRDVEFGVPEVCQAVRLPFQGNEVSEHGYFNFSALSDEFDIEWNVNDVCVECNERSGICGTNIVDEFLCRQPEGNRTLQKILLIGGVSMAALTFTCIGIFLSIRKNHTLLKLLGIQKSKTGKEVDIELFLKDHGNLVLKRYKYSDLKKMTKSFSESLGKGGYGSVYKGKLADGHFVAVKILNESKGNGQEFINEVASISRTSHINVVTLLGFCFEGSKTALVYDFMPNGSLEKYIQNNASFSSEEEGSLGWEKLFEIALGIARGLDYLHQGCNTRILHFDIKPHNILLDKDFNPKISDFGLAKLCPNRSSIVSMMAARGTIGYIAPEVFCSNFGNVSYKSDVYSYGMMVLEIAGEKKRIDRGDVDRTSETYFPQYIYNQLELMDSRVDHGIGNEDASQLAKRKLITVGLWCIQTDPKDRPSMSKVVEMLEGKIDSLEFPPKPCLSSLPSSALDFSTGSQSM